MSETSRGSGVKKLRSAIGPDKRIAFVSGNFNILHPGHLRLLRFAAELADVLVVGVTQDDAPDVTVPVDIRLDSLKSVAHVGHVLVLQEPVCEFVAKLKPDVVVKGKEFETHENPEQAVVEKYGGKLVFSSGEVRFSTLDLLQRDYMQPNFSSITKPTDYPLRHGFRPEDMKDILPKIAGIRVLVVGDLIVDTYVNCDPLGMSQEDPTIVVTPIESKTFVGGAGIVAAHASGLGADVQLVTVAGADQFADFSREHLAKFGVGAAIVVDDSRPTTHKKRYRAQGKTLLRVNDLRQHAIVPDLMDAVAQHIEGLLPQTDLLLFADYNYGCLPQALVTRITEMARKRKIMMAADSQASSQIADISRYKGMTMITPTEREARLALQDFESGLIVIAERLQQAAEAKHVVVTLGAEGLIMHAHIDKDEYRTDRLPAFNTSPKDVAGAGDSFFTAASLALRAGVDIWRSGYLGALAAACQVSRVGNTPLGIDDLINEINAPDPFAH